MNIAFFSESTFDGKIPRNFDNISPWEGMGKYLPGDEKSDKAYFFAAAPLPEGGIKDIN